MPTLYCTSNCPFCQRIIQIAENLHIQLDVKDVSEDDQALAELVEKGGGNQVPYFIDSEKGAAMHETNDIIEYLREHYSGSKSDDGGEVRPRVYISSAVCESCEG